MYSTAGNYDRYDRFGRTIKQKWGRYSGTALTYDHINYGYDYAGNRTWREDTLAKAQSTPKYFDEFFTYDGLHRLKDAQRGQLTGSPFSGVTSKNFAQDWELDALGNWWIFKQDDDGTGWDLQQERAHTKANEFIDSTGDWYPPSHDNAGNMTDVTDPLSPTTDPLSAKYDAWNRLVEVKQGTTVLTANKYDGLGQRIVRDPAGSSNTYDYYYNDQWQLLTETKDSSVEAIYHWHPHYIDALATRMRASDTHHFLFDANFNITAAVDTSTDAVVERYKYTPYGEVTVLEADFTPDGDNLSDIGNQHLYTGRERDPETGLQLNRHRYYASHLGRWLTRDPIGYEGGSQNLYEYGQSTPTVGIDPEGTRFIGTPCPNCLQDYQRCTIGAANAYAWCIGGYGGADFVGTAGCELGCKFVCGAGPIACAACVAGCPIAGGTLFICSLYVCDDALDRANDDCGGEYNQCTLRHKKNGCTENWRPDPM
jgi:RHS repeat-associated protein